MQHSAKEKFNFSVTKAQTRIYSYIAKSKWILLALIHTVKVLFSFLGSFICLPLETILDKNECINSLQHSLLSKSFYM